MKIKNIFILTFLAILLNCNVFAQAILKSGWTTTTDPIAAKSALGVIDDNLSISNALTSESILVGLFTDVGNQGFYPSISSDGSKWLAADGYSIYGAPANFYLANDSFARISPHRFLSTTFMGTNLLVGREIGFGVLTSTNFLKWNFITNYAVNLPNLTQLWAPELYVDGTNVYVYFAASTNDTTSFNIFVCKALNTNFTSWSTPSMISGLTANVIDPFMIVDNGTNYLWYKNETTKYIEVAISTTSLTNGFTLARTNDWATWGANYEAPTVARRPNGQFVLMADAYSGGPYYRYASSSNMLSGWTTFTTIVSPGKTNRHGTIASVPLSDVASLFNDALLNTNNIIATTSSSGLTQTNSIDGLFPFNFYNTSSGSSAYTEMLVKNGAGAATESVGIGVLGTGFSGFGAVFKPDSGFVVSDTGISGGLSIASLSLNSAVQILAGGHGIQFNVATFTNQTLVLSPTATITGNGIGLTNIPSTGITGLDTLISTSLTLSGTVTNKGGIAPTQNTFIITNSVTGAGVTLFITNGLIMKIQ